MITALDLLADGVNNDGRQARTRDPEERVGETIEGDNDDLRIDMR